MQTNISHRASVSVKQCVSLMYFVYLAWLQAEQTQPLMCAEFAAFDVSEEEDTVCLQMLDGGPLSTAFLILQLDSRTQ